MDSPCRALSTKETCSSVPVVSEERSACCTSIERGRRGRVVPGTRTRSLHLGCSQRVSNVLELKVHPSQPTACPSARLRSSSLDTHAVCCSQKGSSYAGQTAIAGIVPHPRNTGIWQRLLPSTAHTLWATLTAMGTGRSFAGTAVHSSSSSRTEKGRRRLRMGG